MKRLRIHMINLYRLLTSPYRTYCSNRMRATGTYPVGILFYHRVANDHLNDWTISINRFNEQIDWFQENFDLVSLAECQRRLNSGFNDRPTLAITFDDGYADNALNCLPLLIERNIPVTYFVTHHTLEQKPFPHDVKEGVPLATNSRETLLALHQSGVEIGAHSRTHPDFGIIDDDKILYDEVINATSELEQVIGDRIKYFAFPYGQKANLNPHVFDLCLEHGFDGVCSAYGGFNHVGDDAFHLQRIHGDPKISRMRNWLTLDPRQFTTKRYDYLAELRRSFDQIKASLRAKPAKT